jgi:malonyl-CoA/methylmalonyl-CoA synthetase
VSAEGTFQFGDLERASRAVAGALLDGAADLADARVAMLIAPGFEFVAVLLGVWRAGGVAVPLSLSDPPAALAHVVGDAGVHVLVSTAAMAHTAAPVAAAAGARHATPASLLAGADGPRPDVNPDRPALILYTSGTTGRPKGVVLTHANVAAQVASLVAAWRWSARDRALLVLPLHHVHGLVNVVCCAIAAGACCDVLPRFETAAVWARLASGDITVFTAVPTIYHRLIAAWDAAPDDRRHAWSAGARRARVMMSGSAALPVPTLERWRDITGHTLLERYGMTEFGMALSNPIDGDRRPGCVGSPLPGVDVQLVDDDGVPVADGQAGEIAVQGATVFREYWRQPDATRAAFRTGWFRTGDVAVREGGVYRILGRTSVDIIKTGGEKVSALEIEAVARGHAAVADCAAVGVPDAEWGERVCLAVELREPAGVSLDDLRAWLGERLAPAKIPKTVIAVPALPRNAMGKVIKPDISAWFTAGE